MQFHKNDVVRIGSGKVEYTVKGINTDGTVDLTGAKSNRNNVDVSKLTLVSSDWISDDDVANVTPAGTDVTATAQDIAVSASTGLVLIVDGHTVRDGKSFDTLAFELSRLAGTYKRAAIARNGYAVVERKAV